MQRLQFCMNLGEEIDVDSAKSALLHIFGSFSLAQLERFIGTNMQKWSWKNSSQFREPLLDHLQRSSLARRQHSAARAPRQRPILRPCKHVRKMPETPLPRKNRKVK